MDQNIRERFNFLFNFNPGSTVFKNIGHAVSEYRRLLFIELLSGNTNILKFTKEYFNCDPNELPMKTCAINIYNIALSRFYRVFNYNYKVDCDNPILDDLKISKVLTMAIDILNKNGFNEIYADFIDLSMLETLQKKIDLIEIGESELNENKKDNLINDLINDSIAILSELDRFYTVRAILIDHALDLKLKLV
jgi:hypothetical protein